MNQINKKKYIMKMARTSSLDKILQGFWIKSITIDKNKILNKKLFVEKFM